MRVRCLVAPLRACLGGVRLSSRSAASPPHPAVRRDPHPVNDRGPVVGRRARGVMAPFASRRTLHREGAADPAHLPGWVFLRARCGLGARGGSCGRPGALALDFGGVCGGGMISWCAACATEVTPPRTLPSAPDPPTDLIRARSPKSCTTDAACMSATTSASRPPDAATVLGLVAKWIIDPNTAHPPRMRPPAEFHDAPNRSGRPVEKGAPVPWRHRACPARWRGTSATQGAPARGAANHGSRPVPWARRRAR